MYKYAIGTLISLASLSASAYNAQCMDSLCGHKTGIDQEACYRSITNQQQCDASANGAILANRVSDIEYVGVATIKTPETIYKVKTSMEDEFKPLVNRSSSTISSLLRAEKEIESRFRSEIDSQAANEGGTIRHFAFSIERPRGGLDFTIFETSGGATKIKIDSIQLKLSTYLKASKHGIRIWDGNIDIDTGKVSFEGEYDIQTGQISNLAALNYNPSINVDFDTRKIFDLFGASTDEYIQKLETDTRNSLQDSLVLVFQSITSNSTSFFGVNDAIPTGKYIAYGFDAGQILKDAIINADLEEDVTVKITPVKKTFEVHPEIGDRTYTSAKIDMSYGEDIALTVNPIIYIGQGPAPVLSDGRFGTPSDSDAPNTNVGPVDITETKVTPPPTTGIACIWSYSWSGNRTGGGGLAGHTVLNTRCKNSNLGQVLTSGNTTYRCIHVPPQTPSSGSCN